MTKNYFYDNVDMGVEIEFDNGARHWVHMKGSRVDEYLEALKSREGCYFSDCDFLVQQEKQEIRDLLDKAHDLFLESDEFKSYYDAIDSLLEDEEQEKPAKVWTEEEIKNLVQTNDTVLYRALLMLYDCQSNAEKSTASTREANRVGFNAYDAEFLTSVSEFLKRRGYLSDKQKYITRKKLVKYNRQLTRLANA